MSAEMAHRIKGDELKWGGEVGVDSCCRRLLRLLASAGEVYDQSYCKNASARGSNRLVNP